MDRIARCGPWLAPSSQRSSCPAGLICMSTNRAAAQPGCTASGLSSALATASGTAGWLASHPEAEAAVNSADENAIRTYFASHTDQWQQLQGIASGLPQSGCWYRSGDESRT